jgi:hypothetical protein
MFQDQLSWEGINHLLSRWYKVGEKVQLAARDNQGTIIGFGKRYVPRGGHQHKQAGIYINFTKLHVIRDQGWEECLVDVSHLQTYYITPERMELARSGEISKLMIKIGELPETPFWEGDIVSIGYENFGTATVSEIDYSEKDVCYKVEMARPQGHGWSQTVHGWAETFVLVERGNLWKMAHGEPMQFASLEKEAAFYKSLGMSQKLTCMISGYDQIHVCEIGEALAQIRNGHADQMKIKDKRKPTYVLIKYDDREFGKRMRAHTLAKLGFPEDTMA